MRKRQHRSNRFAVGASALLIATCAAQAGDQDFTQIEKGRYLATAADCVACHTIQNGGKPFAGGRAIETPFGNITSPNITPDTETGIGVVDRRAIRQCGAQRRAARRQPALSRDALHVLYEDVARRRRSRSAPISTRSSRSAIRSSPTPCRSRSTSAPRCACGMRFISTPGEFKPDPQKPADWNRGAFLVEGPGHCTACHTPKIVSGRRQERRTSARLLFAGLVCARHHQ